MQGKVVLVDPSHGMTVRWDTPPPGADVAGPPATARDPGARQFTVEY